MGHSSINVSLTYLEIAELKEEDMPTNFQIEIIDRLSKKTDKELDEAIKG